MSVSIRAYGAEDVPEMARIWNEVVKAGEAFPQLDALDEAGAREFFGAQSRCGVAEDADSGEIMGMYILHPNNVGRCGHIANASYAVASAARGRGVGEALVLDSLAEAKRLGFGILQFNAVVASNARALSLYKKLGFVRLGVIPGGFRMDDGRYEDIIPHYHTL